MVTADGTEGSTPESSGKVKKIKAAGVVIWRHGDAYGPDSGDVPDEVELALVHRPQWFDWTFPKGKRKAGERSREAAVREALEETGLRVELGWKLPTQHYTVKGRPKRVKYWSAVRVGGRFAANPEVDRLIWLPASEARRRLTYEHDRELVDALLKHLAEDEV